MPTVWNRPPGPMGGRAYAALREEIVSAELEPGRRLSENELAQRLGVSRTPVREALARLQDDGLVEVVPQLGTFVTHISDGALHEAQFVREALELAAVRDAALRADAEDLAALEGILTRQEEVSASGDYARWMPLDDEFHSALCQSSGHGIAWSLTRRVGGQLDRIRRLSLPQPRYLQEMLAEHRLVLRAVARHDADGAEEALRHHLRMVLAAIPALRRQFPSYFDDAVSEDDVRVGA
jgi:GntR family transcriptional regulator, rspAB operon transcriptional repressor